MWKENWNKAFETRDPAQAKHVLQEILRGTETNPDPIEQAYAYLAAATCSAILGDRNQFRFCLDQARKIGPRNDDVFEMHLEYQEAVWELDGHKFQDALTKLDAIPHRFDMKILDPQFVYLSEQIQFSRAVALIRLDRFTEALAILEGAKAFDLVPADRSLLFFYLGMCHLLEDKNESALADFLESKKLGLPSSDWEGQWFFYIGRIYYRLEEYGKAKEALLEAERLLKSPSSHLDPADVYRLLSYCCKGLSQTVEPELYLRLTKSN